MNLTSRGLLLDTHVWFRYANGSGPLGKEAITAINRARTTGSVYIPMIAVWELAMMVQQKGVYIHAPVSQWVDEALSAEGFMAVGLTPAIAIESVALPEPMHKDPADRMIVATARVERLTLVTRDKEILKYARATGLPYIQA